MAKNNYMLLNILLYTYLSPLCDLKLDIISRHCKRVQTNCKIYHDELRSYMSSVKNNENYIIHYQKKEHGAGIGHVIQEKANTLHLGKLLNRPVRFLYENENIVNVNQSMWGNPLIAQNYSSVNCLPTTSEFSIKCDCVTVNGRILCLNIVEEHANLEKINAYAFPSFPSSTFGFISPNFLLMEMSNRFDESQVRSSQYNGPSCPLSFMLSHFDNNLLQQITPTLSRINKCARVAGIHIRMGDSAIKKECKNCINPNEPDNNAPFRIGRRSVRKKLYYLKKKVLKDSDCSVVISDTKWGQEISSYILPNVYFVPGTIKHTKATELVDADILKLVSDMIIYMVADFHVIIGTSSFSGNLAAVSGSSPVFIN